MNTLEEACKKSKEWYDKLPFEFHWDFASFNDKDLIEAAVTSAYLCGYMDAMKKKL